MNFENDGAVEIKRNITIENENLDNDILKLQNKIINIIEFWQIFNII